MELSILKRASLPPSQATAREVTRPTQMKAGVQGGFSGQDARPQIENANPSTGTAELSVFRLAPSEGGNLLNPEDETTDYHLYQALTEAAKEMELDWPDPFDWKRIKTRIIEIAFGCLVFAAPVGFSIACWQGLGYACEIIFSRSGSSGSSARSTGTIAQHDLLIRKSHFRTVDPGSDTISPKR